MEGKRLGDLNIRREYDLVIFDNQSQVLRRQKFEVGNYKRTGFTDLKIYGFYHREH